MANHRTDLRNAAWNALRVAVRMRDMVFIKAWAQGIDEETLPAWTVATPREQSGAAAKDTLRRDVMLSVIVKRTGGDDIEDQLDLDSAAIEAAVLPVILPLCLHAEIDQTDMKMQGQGERRVGVVEVRFACTLMTDTSG